MRRRPFIGSAIAAVPGVSALAVPHAPAGRGGKTLHLAFPSAETTFDPPQTNSDLNASVVLAQILEAPLCFDYLARPARLMPATAAALPEVSADGSVFTVRIRSRLFASVSISWAWRCRPARQ